MREPAEMREPLEVRARCECGRLLAPMPLFRVATDLRRRTCRGCGVRWLVKVVPVAEPLLGMHVHEATLTKMETR